MFDVITPHESYPENVNAKIKFCDNFECQVEMQKIGQRNLHAEILRPESFCYNLKCQMEKTSAKLNPTTLVVKTEDLDVTTLEASTLPTQLKTHS